MANKDTKCPHCNTFPVGDNVCVDCGTTACERCAKTNFVISGLCTKCVEKRLKKSRIRSRTTSLFTQSHKRMGVRHTTAWINQEKKTI
jgi:hypothetical protein